MAPDRRAMHLLADMRWRGTGGVTVPRWTAGMTPSRSGIGEGLDPGRVDTSRDRTQGVSPLFALPGADTLHPGLPDPVCDRGPAPTRSVNPSRSARRSSG